MIFLRRALTRFPTLLVAALVAAACSDAASLMPSPR